MRNLAANRDTKFVKQPVIREIWPDALVAKQIVLSARVIGFRIVGPKKAFQVHGSHIKVLSQCPANQVIKRGRFFVESAIL